MRILKVQPSLKFPNGIKARFVLLDLRNKKACLLIDNHEPFGFHVHDKLPTDQNSRRRLETTDHWEALAEFLKMAEEIAKNET
jgi:hypothetical protein